MLLRSNRDVLVDEMLHLLYTILILINVPVDYIKLVFDTHLLLLEVVLVLLDFT